MVRSNFVRSVTVGCLLILFVVSSPLEAQAATCNSGNVLNNVCTSGQLVGNGVNVSGSTSSGGGRVVSSNTTTTGGAVTTGSRSSQGGVVKRASNTTGMSVVFPDCRELGVATRRCTSKKTTPTQSSTTETFTYIQPVTITDISRFIPEPVSVVSQPQPWTVVDLPTNFIGSARVHIVSGSLFGLPAEVRFTPFSYDWNYGDGASQTTNTLGSRWENLGLAEFSPTATSHVYRQVGSYNIGLRVHYRAEYRYVGGQWYSIEGELTAPANTAVLMAFNAETVLTADDCNGRPSAPGCF